MSEITREALLRLADLARISLTEGEVEHFRRRMRNVLGYVQELQQLPLSEDSFVRHVPDDCDGFREDLPVPFDSERLLTNAPQVSEGCFEVPTVVEKS